MGSFRESSVLPELAVHQGIEIDVVDEPGAGAIGGHEAELHVLREQRQRSAEHPDRRRRLPGAPCCDVAEVGEPERLRDE